MSISCFQNILKNISVGIVTLGLFFFSSLTTPIHAAILPEKTGEITFVSDRDGNLEIYTMKPDGTNQARLTNNAGRDVQPARSPNGEWIVFSSDRNGGEGDLWIMEKKSNETALMQLTSSGAATDRFPAWSPKGDLIYFDRYLNPTSPINIYKVTATGGTPEFVIQGEDPSPSPDGTKLVFSRQRSFGPAKDIYIYDLFTGTVTNITNGLGVDQGNVNPTWSPEGNQIMYTQAMNNQLRLRIYDITDNSNIVISHGNFSSSSWGEREWYTYDIQNGSNFQIAINSTLHDANQTLTSNSLNMQPDWWKGDVLDIIEIPTP